MNESVDRRTKRFFCFCALELTVKKNSLNYYCPVTDYSTTTTTAKTVVQQVMLLSML